MCPAGDKCVSGGYNKNKSKIDRIKSEIDANVLAVIVIGRHDYRNGSIKNYELAKRRAQCVVNHLPQIEKVKYLAIPGTNKYVQDEQVTQEQLQSDRTASVMIVRSKS